MDTWEESIDRIALHLFRRRDLDSIALKAGRKMLRVWP